MARLRTVAWRSVSLFACLATVASPKAAETDARSPEAFNEWRAANEQKVGPYQRFLEQRQVHGIVPMHQLMRTSSDWRKKACQQAGASPFDVPPEEDWERMAATLRLIAELRSAGSLPTFEVVSAYRAPLINVCSKSTSDRHVKNAALDLVFSNPSAMDTATSLVCDFYWREGQAHAIGLGFYGKSRTWPNGRMHIDTLRFATWGPNGRGPTSPCLRAPKRPK